MPDTDRTDYDLAARTAFATVCKRLGGYSHIAERYKIRLQTARRIWKGTRPVPRSLAREIAAAEIAERRYDTGNALLAWADQPEPFTEIAFKRDGDAVWSLEFPNDCANCEDSPPYPLDESGLCEQCQEEFGG